MITVLVAASAATALVVAFVIRRRSIEWDLASTFILLAGWAYQLPRMLGKLTGGIVYRRDLDGELVAMSGGWTDPLRTAADYAVLGLALFVIVRSIRRSQVITWSRPGLALIGIVLIGAAVQAVLGASPPPLTRTVLIVSVLVATTVLRTSRAAVAAGAAMLAVTVCIAGGMTAAVAPAAVQSPCRDKCSPAGFLYSGVESHGNSLGLLLALSIPFIWTAFGSARVRAWMTGYVGFNLLLTGSRTALLAGVVALAVAIVVGMKVDVGRVNWRGGLAVAAAAITAGIALVFPFLEDDPSFATGRGRLWRLARSEISERPIFGSGLDRWSELFQFGQFGRAAAYSTHNQWLDILLISGWVGAALLVFAVVTWLTREPACRYAAAPVLAAVFVMGITERPIAVNYVNELTWALLALVILAQPSRADDADVSARPSLPGTPG